MAFDNMLDDCQAQARAARGTAAAWIGAIEPASQVGKVFWRNAWPMIANGQRDPACAGFINGNLHRLIRCAILQRVVDQIA